MSQDSPPPNGSPASATASGPPSLYVLQVRAFLQAAEDVPVEAETIVDILGDFAENAGTLGSEDEPDPSEQGDVSSDDDIDISALYSAEKSRDCWSKQEIGHMLHHLKEKGMDSFVRQYVGVRGIPIPKLLLAFGVVLCKELTSKRPQTLLYFLRVVLSRELSLRDKLPQYNTLADAVSLIRNAKRIIILTGAGISVSCGIPDFRSRDGLYASLKERGEWELDDPQQMFDIHYFRENPAVFYSFAREIYPSNFVPSPCHRFIKVIEDKGKLLRNYTQNIDTLETLAGVERVLQCHGSFARASCVQCKRSVPGKEIEREIMRGEVPLCTMCNVPTPRDGRGRDRKGKNLKRGKKSGWDSEEEDSESDDEPAFPPGIMKPDITFFGEKLTTEFEDALLADREVVDLLLVIGTSLKVAPVSDTLTHLPQSVPQILINKTPVRHINPDIVLLGNADAIVLHLCRELGWDLPAPSATPSPAATPQPNGRSQLHPGLANLRKRLSEDALDREQPPRRAGNSHVWLFEGAEGGNWVRDLENVDATDDEEPEPSEDGSTLPRGSDGREAKKARVG